MKTIRHGLPPVLLVALLAAGCTSPVPQDKTAATEPAEEYYTYTITGSNIPHRIKKSDYESGKLPKGADVQTVDKEEFQKSMRPGRQLDKGGGG